MGVGCGRLWRISGKMLRGGGGHDDGDVRDNGEMLSSNKQHNRCRGLTCKCIDVVDAGGCC